MLLASQQQQGNSAGQGFIIEWVSKKLDLLTSKANSGEDYDKKTLENFKREVV